MRDTLDKIEAFINEGGFHQIATANVNFLANSLRVPELQRVLSSCDVVVPDGMPLIWLSRLLGQPLKERVTGVDLVPQIAELSQRKGHSIYFLGATEEHSRIAVENLLKQFPNMKVAGRYCPPCIPLDEQDNTTILNRIRAAKPDILLVAFGNPKQDLWLARHRNDLNDLNVPVAIGIGGTLEFLAGVVNRAPDWMQNSGLEWLYRVVQEPRRLASRYINDFTGLFFPMLRQLLALFLQGAPKSLSYITLQHCGDVTMLRLEGGLIASDMERVCDLLESDPDPRRHLLLDMHQIHYLGADALAILLRLGSLIDRHEGTIWLTGLNQHIAAILRPCNAGHLLRTAKSSDAVVERFPATNGVEKYHKKHVQRLQHTEALRYLA